jgi:ribose transport system ATP-binding protein
MTDNESLLSVENISKSFPGVLALDQVSFDVQQGEIHGLVGENGAGKSTLMRIMSGAYQPDSGIIYIRGRKVKLESPIQSHKLGIGMVYQDTQLVGELDIVQNIFLGDEISRNGLLDRNQMERRVVEILGSLGIELPLYTKIKYLSLSERQTVEIARALRLSPDVLILDEPTTGLDHDEVYRLFNILRKLKENGTGIVFISHRLPEVFKIADRITVMKDGCVIETLKSADTIEADLVNLMVGREIDMVFPPKNTLRPRVRLECLKLSNSGEFREVSFCLSSGEILGLGGIQGNGQRELIRALAGIIPFDGTIFVDGVETRLSSPKSAIENGIVYLSSDRRGESLFLPHSIRENMLLPHLDTLNPSRIVSTKKNNSITGHLIDKLRIQTVSAEQPVELLSGGNQQKVVVGRWLVSKPEIYLFDEPTQGVDVGTKLELYRIMRELAMEGAAILVLSTEVTELVGLCDRMLVMADGRIVDTISEAEATEERVVGSAVTANRKDEKKQQNKSTPKTVSKINLLAKQWMSAFLVLALVVLIGIITQYHSKYFLMPRNLSNLALQIVPLAIVSMGVMATLLVGGIDLSVGPTMSLITIIASFIITKGSALSILLGIVGCLSAGAFIGLINGFIIRYLNIPDLITTLATNSMVFGVALILRPAPGGSVNLTFMDLVTHRINSVPVFAIIVLVMFILGEIILLRGKIGMALYATGSNEEAARIAGIPVSRVRVAAYVFSGLLAALAGLIVAARIGSGDPQSGTNFTLLSITAVVVGGTSIFGGRGTLLGTLAGSILVMTTQSSLNQLHVSAYYQYIWIGLLTLLSVALYSAREAEFGFNQIIRHFLKK